MTEDDSTTTGSALWAMLTNRTWEQLRAAVYVAELALAAEAGEGSDDARAALDSMDRILSDDWDGLEGRPDKVPSPLHELMGPPGVAQPNPGGMISGSMGNRPSHRP